MKTGPASTNGSGDAAARRHFIVLGVLLAAGLLLRVFGAWCYAGDLEADHGVVCLMVKHMLQGGRIPVFYLGQSYMGSMEPILSAGLSALFSLSGFWINMGTALAASAFLPLVYLWGRSAAGRTGGLAAVAFCLVGPPHYFRYMSWSYGGYAAIPLLTCLVLVMTQRLLAGEARGKRASHFQFLLLGAAAGIGWWQSPLLIPALITSTLLFLAVMRRRLFSLRLLSGLFGFAWGSLPLWIENARNGWQTFDMLKTHGSPPLLRGLALFYRIRLPDLFDGFRQASFLHAVFPLLLALLAALALARLAAHIRNRNWEQAIGLGSAVLFLVVFSVLFGQSRFARVPAPRYMLMLVPVTGILVGSAIARLTASARRGWGWLPLVALVAAQALTLPNPLLTRKKTAAFEEKTAAFAVLLRRANVTHLYADYLGRANYGLNFGLREEFVFSPQTRERYPPYAAAMELADRPAVLADSLNFTSFLAATAGTAKSGGAREFTVHYDILPPADNWRPIPPAEWASLSSAGNRDLLPLLADGSRNTLWLMPPAGKDKAALTLRFKRPQRLVGVRVLSEGAFYPADIGIKARNEASGQWLPMVPETPVTRYFWSGPRFYWGGERFRLECRFTAVETRELRIRLGRSAGKNAACAVMELQAMGEGPEPVPPPDQEALDRLAAELRARGIKRLYADRWEANQLVSRLGPDVRLSLEPRLFSRDSLDAVMSLDSTTAILVRECEADFTRRNLGSRFVSPRETVLEPWLLFDFPGDRASEPHARTPHLRWAGFGCVRDGDTEWAALAAQSAQARQAQRDFANAIPLAERALELDPDCRPLADTLAACYGALGNREKADAFRLLATAMWKPDVPVPAHFENGIELLGLTFDKPVYPGKPFRLKFYWRIPPGASSTGLFVFLHFNRDERAVLQDDHRLPANAPGVAGQLPPEVIVEERTVLVPAGLPPGDLQIEAGLYRPGGKGRIPVKSDYRTKNNAVSVPVPLPVRPFSESPGQAPATDPGE